MFASKFPMAHFSHSEVSAEAAVDFRKQGANNLFFHSEVSAEAAAWFRNDSVDEFSICVLFENRPISSCQ